MDIRIDLMLVQNHIYLYINTFRILWPFYEKNASIYDWFISNIIRSFIYKKITIFQFMAVFSLSTTMNLLLDKILFNLSLLKLYQYNTSHPISTISSMSTTAGCLAWGHAVLGHYNWFETDAEGPYTYSHIHV